MLLSSQEPEFALAVVPLVYMALSIGLSLLAGYLLKGKAETPMRDERPSPLATRGSYCAWFMGVRRLGYVVTWAGDRRTKRISVGKGSFTSSKGDPKEYKESAMHVISVGPVHELLEIEQGGKIIFEGPINSITHPSGSFIDLGGEGGFRIYWGEDDQPVNTYLGDSDRIGVSSRWPNFCYIMWIDKRLGASPNWPLLSYTMVRRPTGDHLSDSDAWVDPTYTLDGQTFDTFYSVDAPSNTITLQAASGPGQGDFTALIRSGNRMRLTGAAIIDQDLNVYDVSVSRVIAPSGAPQFLTTIEFEEDITGITVDGELQLYRAAEDDGANPAHLVADLLFEKWPQGVSLDKSGWDLDSMEEMGVNEPELRLSTLAQDGADALSTLGGILQDLGYMLPMDPSTGLLRFVPLRDTTGQTLPHLDSRKIVGVLPELEKVIGKRPVDALSFKFQDRATNFRDMTIGRSEDGQISRLEVASARTIEIPNVVHYGTASIVANRRTQEEMANAAVWTVITNRATREWYPGMPFTAEFTNEVLRLVESQATPDSNQVTLKVMADAYGVAAADLIDTQPPIPPGVLPAQQDLIYDLIELSEYVPSVPPQSAIIARVRAHAQIEGSIIHISADDTTYFSAIEMNLAYPGGVLVEPLTEDGFYEVEGLQFAVYGPDISEVLDLSGDPYNWRLGRLLCLLVSDTSYEICFAQGVTALTAETYQIDGLIRARYETRRQNHAFGTRVYFIDIQTLDRILDPLLAPEVTRYAKSQPFGAGIVDLSIIAPASRLLYGNGVRPVPVAAVRVVEPHRVNGYTTGDDVAVVWDYATPNTPGTSAGLQDAGTPVGTTAPEGEFYVQILSLADAVVREETVSAARFEYSNADLVADLGSEVDFKVRVYQLRNGYISSPETITVEKV